MASCSVGLRISSASRQSSLQAASCCWSLSRPTRSLNRDTLAWCLARLWRTVQAIFSNSDATAWARCNSRRERITMSFVCRPFPEADEVTHRRHDGQGHRNGYLKTPQIHGRLSPRRLPCLPSYQYRVRDPNRACKTRPRQSWPPAPGTTRRAHAIDVMHDFPPEMVHVTPRQYARPRCIMSGSLESTVTSNSAHRPKSMPST